MEEVCNDADRAWTTERTSRLAPLAPIETLVTGAGGFLGAALVRRLRSEGTEVRVLVRRPLPWMERDPGIQIVVGDLGDPQIVAHAVAGVELVYHVGAAMRGDSGDFAAGTIWGTRNIVDACLRSRTRRLVYVSSLSVLDHAGRNPGEALSESAMLEPKPELRGLYTQTKLDAERLVADAISKHGLPAVIIRPGQIFGPGAEKTTPNGVVAFGSWWIAVGPGAQTIPLVFLEDVVDSLLHAGTRPGLEGRCFHVIDPRPTGQAEYLAAVRRNLGNEIRIVRIPAPMFVGLAAVVEALGRLLGRDVPLTRYRARSLRPLANLQPDAARRDLGWEARVGVEAGLARTFPAR
jgi:nucleoside-diphosphate-sugar epimerase